jgi:pantoate--beta-alanine ligase
MGFFHEGHIGLMRRSIKECDETFISIFVNPMQFGPSEDLAAYPRDLQRDIELSSGAGVKYIFHPDAKEMYPDGFQTVIKAGPLACGFCGASRPGHFDGVCTVVAKLFNIITPDFAYFGMKDYQQLVIIEKMAADLNTGVNIVKCPTAREKDGLAMSSRNSYLSPAGRAAAPALARGIQKAESRVIELISNPQNAGGDIISDIITEFKNDIIKSGFDSLDYFKIADAETLLEFKDPAPLRRAGQIFIAAAAYIGKTRLIDNIVFKNPLKNE